MLLLLDATTKSIEAVSSSGSTDIVFVTSYADSTSSTFTEGASDGAVSTTDTTIVAAPSTSTRRVIKSINFYNTAASSRTVTLKYNNNGTKRTVAVFTLTAGENWSTDDLAGGGGGISSLTVGTTPITGTNGSILYVNGSVLGEIATTGTGNIVRASSPTLTTPNLGTPSAATLTNATGLPLTTGVTGTLPVGNGGTGATSLTANNVLLGNGTSALQAVAPGANGNVLTSNGTTWVSQAAPAGGDSYTNDTSTPTVTTADITGAVNTRYRFDISGLTNARDFILPAPSAVGDRIEINITTGDTAVGATNYELVLRGAWTGSSWVTINGGNASVSATVSAANDTITALRHNLRLGDPIYFTSAPGGLSTNTVYYVRDSAVNSDGVDSTFKVSSTRGGAALDITSGTTATYVPLEWSRLFITGESVTLTATSTTNWQVTNDRRIPALVRLQATATQTFTANQVLLNTNLIAWDNGAMGDLTTDKITIRRTGKYVITCAARITGSADPNAGIPNTLTRYAAWIRENGSAASEAYMVFGEMSATAGSLPAVLLVTTGLLRRTNNYEVQLFSSNTSGIQTDARPYPHFAATEMLE